MTISNINVQNLLKVYGKQLKTDSVRPKEGVTATRKAADDIKISGEGKLMQKAIMTAKQAEDFTDKNKIEDLKQAIASGTYTVNEDEVAEKMIYNAIVDKMV
ncbi:MAG: flagellar biosynthesis anti-sigma factor FlgM [Candidatus Saccharibacteria bacterium]